MATAIPPAANNSSKYFLNAHQVSPPETYYGQAATTAAANMQPQTPPSNNVSPTNYQSPMHVRQLRQPRTPLYIPAALRPTETRATDIPKRPQAPDTPPASKDSSFDSGIGTSTTSLGKTVTFSPSQEDTTSTQEPLHLRLTKSTTESLTSIPSPVTGPPTTAHWKPDSSAPDCAVCHTTFTWYFRRHHCRHCGDVVCDNHSRKLVPLDQNARFHAEGEWSKSCDPCASDWVVVKKIRRSRAGSLVESESETSSQGTAVPIPQAARQAHAQEARVGSLARSEGGMVWSTF